MHALMRPVLASLWLLSCPAWAQEEYREETLLATDRPEAWAMNYFTASSLMTGFGETPALAAGRWRVAGELGHIPHLDADQQQVGFDGIKREDLNKSPVFGRLRLHLGLGAGWVGELGYTPPVAVNNLRPRDLFAAAFGRRLLERPGFNLSARAFGQHGAATGDITCPAELAGSTDPERNPFGCQAASKDRVTLNYYGLDATAAWTQARWQWHATLGAARTEPEVQVDALTFDVHDRSHLVTRDVLPYFAVGLAYAPTGRWQAAVELLHVPLYVRRGADADRERDSLTSLRLRLALNP